MKLEIVVGGQPITLWGIEPQTPLFAAVAMAQAMAGVSTYNLETEVRDSKGRLLKVGYPIEAYRFDEGERLFYGPRPGVGG